MQQLILVSCSLLATNAMNSEFTLDATDQQCDKLFSECNQLRDQCSPDMVMFSSWCDLISFPPSKAPSKAPKEFEEGFGDLKAGKLRYGLKSIYHFTNTGQWELRIDL